MQPPSCPHLGALRPQVHVSNSNALNHMTKYLLNKTAPFKLLTPMTSSMIASAAASRVQLICMHATMHVQGHRSLGPGHLQHVGSLNSGPQTCIYVFGLNHANVKKHACLTAFMHDYQAQTSNFGAWNHASRKKHACMKLHPMHMHAGQPAFPSGKSPLQPGGGWLGCFGSWPPHKKKKHACFAKLMHAWMSVGHVCICMYVPSLLQLAVFWEQLLHEVVHLVCLSLSFFPSLWWFFQLVLLQALEVLAATIPEEQLLVWEAAPKPWCWRTKQPSGLEHLGRPVLWWWCPRLFGFCCWFPWWWCYRSFRCGRWGVCCCWLRRVWNFGWPNHDFRSGCQ